MDKRTVAGGLPRTDVGWIGEYRPLHLAGDVWAEVRTFVIGCASELQLDGGAAAVRAVRALSQLAAWAYLQGLPLDVEVVLDPDTVERFIAAQPGNEHAKATCRSVLRRLGPRLTRRAPWEARPAPVARRQVALPYTADGIRGLRAAADAQPTAGRRRAARALLALGAGAGLDGRWVAKVRASDVVDEGRAVFVRVGEPAARTVPVLALHEDELVDLAESAGDEFLVGGRSTSRNRAGALAASLVVAHGQPRFSSSRLRSTWLVTHLTAGTRLPELARAAGLQGVTVLSDLLPFVPALDDDAAITMLRGAR